MPDLNDGRLLKKEKRGTHLTRDALKCPNCDRSVQPDDTFCPGCGKGL